MKSLVKLLVGLLLALPPAGAASDPSPPFPHTPLNVANGCFVESVAFCDDFLDRYGASAWCRVLQWGAQEDAEVVAGHAVAVFELNGKLWCWDVNFGFSPQDTDPGKKETVALVAAPLIAKYPRISAYFPVYRLDTPQTPAAQPPAEISGLEDLGLRDASRVAVRLATHRPVKLVQFTFPKDGQTQPGAACAFVFNGRLCIYLPNVGTVPFRTTALSVANLRQLQEMIRKVLPGATDLKAR